MAPLKVRRGWESELWFHKERIYVKYDPKCIKIVVQLYVLDVEIVLCCEWILCIICHIVVLNHSYVLTSVERANWFIEARETSGSDCYWEPGESPARGISGNLGIAPAQIVLASPGEARLWCLCYSLGEARLGCLCYSSGEARLGCLCYSPGVAHN